MDGGERAATRPHPTFRRSIVSIAALRIARTLCFGLLLALVGIVHKRLTYKALTGSELPQTC